MNFDVHLLSLEAAPGRDPVEALVQVFRLDQRRAEQLLSRLPYVVKRGVSREQAERVVDLLRRIGGNAEMLPSAYVEPIEGSLVAPLPLEPPPRFRPQAPGEERAPATGTHGMPPEYAAPDVRDPFRSAPSKQFEPNVARQAARAPQQQPMARPQPAPRPQAQPAARSAQQPAAQSARMAKASPAVRAGAPAKAPVPGQRNHDTLERESDGFEADISAVLPPSFPPAKGVSAPSLRPAPVRNPSLRPPAGPVRTQPAYQAAPAPAHYQANPAQDGRASMYGAPHGYRETAAPVPSARGTAVPAHSPLAESPAPRAPAYPQSMESEAPSQAQRASAYGTAAHPLGVEASMQAAPVFGTSTTGAFRAMPEPTSVPVQAFAAPPTGSFRTLAETAPASTSLRSPPSADNTQTIAVFPTLAIHGAPVTAKHQVVPGTTNAVGWSLVALCALGLVALASFVLVSHGYVLAMLFGALIGAHVLHGFRQMHALRASGIPVGQGQLPEIYACVKQFSLRLGLADVPATYITRNAIRGARAHRKWKRIALELDEAFVLDLVQSPRPEALSFHIARELARHALGQTRALRRLLALINPWLARRDVLSADAAATALVVDRGITRAALLALFARPLLARHLDAEEIERVAVSLRRDGQAWTLLHPERCVLARLDAFVRGYR